MRSYESYEDMVAGEIADQNRRDDNDLVKRALEDCHTLAHVWALNYQATHGLDEIHPQHQEILDRGQQALELIREEC